MLHFYATQKLRAKLPLDNNGLLPGTDPRQWPQQRDPMAENRLSGWHANMVILQRRQCVLMVHDTTRFPVFIPGLTKADFAIFNDRFVDSFMNTLLKCGAEDMHMQAAHNCLQPLQADSSCNRSVLGTLNNMQVDVEHMLWHNNANVAELAGYSIGAWLADRPCKAKGTDWLWPQKDMLALLEGMACAPDKPPAPANVVLLQEYRDKKTLH